MHDFGIYVFSYNRAAFLENCMNSIEKLGNTNNVTILDDGSDDPKTLDVLEKWKCKYNVVNAKEENETYKTGGLYKNMNYAMYDAHKKNIKYALFIQDDMQLIREITSYDINSFDAIFATEKNSAQLYVCFLKKKNKLVDLRDMFLSKSKLSYTRPVEGKKDAGFSATGVFNVPRFLEFFDGIKFDERKTNRLAEESGIILSFYVFPFMMWLPLPVSYRRNNNKLGHRLSEKIAKTGFYPFEFLNQEESNKLFTRDLKELPYAEDYLVCLNAPKRKIWAYGGGVEALIDSRGWRRIIGILISKFFK